MGDFLTYSSATLSNHTNKPSLTRHSKHNGFTLIELIVVIVILGLLAVVAVPRFMDVSRDAKIATLKSIKGTMESTADLVQVKARAQGLEPVSTNPNAGQTAYIVDFGFGSSEVHFSNLCPESSAEMGSALDMKDFIVLESDDITAIENNQYTYVGYDIPSAAPTLTQGCYIIYDSFTEPDCTITLVDADC